MKIRIAVSALTAAFILSMGASAPATAQTQRHYDCSKSGNATKAACKMADKPAAAAKPAHRAKSAVTLTPTTAARPVVVKPAPSVRNYDCSKAGNANKTVCKGRVGVAHVAKQATAPASPHVSAPSVRNYDCSKAGNANKTACRGTTISPPAPVAHPAVAPASSRAPSTATKAAGPQGATAKCHDNTYSHSKTHSGACSSHGGVTQWY